MKIFFFLATATLFLTASSNAQITYVANLKKIEIIVAENASFLNDCYKRFHEFPELSTKEINTAAFLKSTIKSYGYSIVDSLGYQSFAAVLKNGKGLAFASDRLKDKEDIIVEIKGRKTLHVYDFDDTLVKTTTPVIVVDKEGNKKEITSHEFATHKLQPGEKYDFSRFDAAIKGSKPILKNLTQMFNSLENPSIKTTILTARRIAFPIMKHLRDDYGIDVYVIGVGSSDPEIKADWIEKQVEKGYNDIKFVDDSQKNLDAVEKRLAKYPDLDITLINSLK